MEQLPSQGNHLSATGLIQASLILWTAHKMFLHVGMAVFGLLSWNARSRVFQGCGTALASCYMDRASFGVTQDGLVADLGPRNPSFLRQHHSEIRGCFQSVPSSFFDQISRLYWNHSMQHRFMFECIFSFYFFSCFMNQVKKKLSCDNVF